MATKTHQKAKIVTITKDNLYDYNPTCFMSEDHQGCQTKLKWVEEQFANGMKIQLLFPEGEKKYRGYIEYVPGQFAWRAVDAKDFMFIHCIWVSPKKVRSKGFGRQLVKQAIDDAEQAGMKGVAVVVSGDAFMAEKELFEKMGFESVDSAKPSFDLMAKSLQENLKKDELPSFRDTQKQLKKLTGLHLIYTLQCPWVDREIENYKKLAQKAGLELKVQELKTPKEAQNAPSVYTTFNFIKDGEILADHYVSSTRFKNILEKEI
jgi:L-amino acid N-acyltransferase YncA